jgi:hypothetical protein
MHHGHLIRLHILQMIDSQLEIHDNKYDWDNNRNDQKKRNV